MDKGGKWKQQCKRRVRTSSSKASGLRSDGHVVTDASVSIFSSEFTRTRILPNIRSYISVGDRLMHSHKLRCSSVRRVGKLRNRRQGLNFFSFARARRSSFAACCVGGCRARMAYCSYLSMVLKVPATAGTKNRAWIGLFAQTPYLGLCDCSVTALVATTCSLYLAAAPDHVC